MARTDGLVEHRGMLGQWIGRTFVPHDRPIRGGSGEGEDDDTKAEGDRDGDALIEKDNDGRTFADYKSLLAEANDRTNKAEKKHERASGLLKSYETEEGGLLDVSDYRTWQGERADREKQRLRDEGEYEKLLEGEQSKTADAKAATQKLLADWHNERIDGALLRAAGVLGASKQAMAPIGGNGSCQVTRLYRADFKVDDDGNVVHRNSRTDSGKLMTPDDFLAAEKQGAGANLFITQRQGGSGEGPGEDGEGKDSVVKIDNNDPKKLAKYEAATKAGHRVEITRADL